MTQTIDAEKAIQMLNDGLKPKTKYDRNGLADLCLQGHITPFIQFVGGVSITNEINIDFERYDNTPSQLDHPTPASTFITNTDLQTLVRYPHKKVYIEYGQMISPIRMKTGSFIRLAPHGYFNPDNVELLGSYQPNYKHEVASEELLFSDWQINKFINDVKEFEDLTAPLLEVQASDTPANTLIDNGEYQPNQRKPIKHLLYALIKAQKLTLTEKGKGNANEVLFNLTQNYDVPVTEGFLQSRLIELYQLEQELQNNSKNKS